MLISCAIASHDLDIRVRRDPGFPHWTCAYLYRGGLDLRADRDRFHLFSPTFFVIPPRLAYEFTVAAQDEHIWAIFDASPRIAREAESFTAGIHVQPLSADVTPQRFAFERSHRGQPRTPPGTGPAPGPPLWGARTRAGDVLPADGAAIADEIAVAMRQMLAWWQQDPIRISLAENALERAMLLTLERARDAHPHDPRIAAALNYIAGSWRTPITVPQLAEVAHLSASRFQALFRQETGTTPAAYIETMRLEHARDLLLAGHDSIAEIAESVGFQNAFHFSTRFRGRYGQPPREFRRAPMRRRFEIEPEPATAMSLAERSL